MKKLSGRFWGTKLLFLYISLPLHYNKGKFMPVGKEQHSMEDQKKRVYDALDKLNIKYEVVEHEPVHTMEDMDRLGLPAKGTLCKNLFLRDAKGKRHFLVTCEESKKVDLKSLGRQLGGGNLSFASEDRLEKYLGLKQGSVSPFGLMNDTDHQVEFFIDKDLSRCKSLGIHPLENTATVFLSYKDLDKFLWDLDVDVIKIKI